VPLSRENSLEKLAGTSRKKRNARETSVKGSQEKCTKVKESWSKQRKNRQKRGQKGRAGLFASGELERENNRRRSRTGGNFPSQIEKKASASAEAVRGGERDSLVGMLIRRLQGESATKVPPPQGKRVWRGRWTYTVMDS